jgi:hypothetical protein
MDLMMKTKIIAFSESCWLFEGTRHRLNFVKNFGKKPIHDGQPFEPSLEDRSFDGSRRQFDLR